MGAEQSKLATSLLQHEELIAEILGDSLIDEEQVVENEETTANDTEHLSNRPNAPRTRDRAYALNEMERLSDAEFTRMFRLNRAAFSWLLEQIHPIIAPHASQSGGRYHPPGEVNSKTKLAATLRWLAGGSYLDICFAFGIASSTFYKADVGILWPTISAIDAVLEIGVPLHDPVELERTSRGFAAKCNNHVNGCVMAIDGWVCRTRCPSKKEVANQLAYRNRKGMWGLSVMAGCDDQCRFTMLSTVCPGSTNDSLSWRMSKVYNEIVAAGLLPARYFLISDEAITAGEVVLSPFPGRSIGKWRDSFNFHLSAMRQTIERAFGILTRRWGIFWRPLVCDFARWTLVIRVCAKLHNLCIDHNIRNDAIPTAAEDHAQGDTAEAVLNVYNSENDGEFPLNSDQTSQRRLRIAEYLKNQGWGRPAHASCNSRA